VGNHRKLIQLNMRLFNSSIQQKYGVRINFEDPASIQWLSIKSGIDAKYFESVYSTFKKYTVPGHTVSTKELHEFYTHMQFIYQKIQH
jgi:hypothetical protein